MATVRFKRKSQESLRNEEENTPQENANLLHQLGSGALSAMHTVGSVLSAPSRWTWGTLNGVFGGEGGYGNMSLTDSTNGIELSNVLGNLGIIQKNDPNAWEWMDPVRGLIDIAGDPTTYINPLTYTTKGMAAIKGAGKSAASVADDAAEIAAQTAADVAARSVDDIAPEAAETIAREATPSRWADQGVYRSEAEALDAAQAMRSAAATSPYESSLSRLASQYDSSLAGIGSASPSSLKAAQDAHNAMGLATGGVNEQALLKDWEDGLAHIRGLRGGNASEQKKILFEMMKISPDEFHQFLKENGGARAYINFVKAHELGHIQGGGSKYGSLDYSGLSNKLLHPEHLKEEIRATEYALEASGFYKWRSEKAKSAVSNPLAAPLHEDLGGLYGSARGTGEGIHTGPIPDTGLFAKVYGDGSGIHTGPIREAAPSMDEIFRTADSTVEMPKPVFNRAEYPPATAIQPEEILSAGLNPLNEMSLLDQIRGGYRGVGGIQLPFMKPLTEGFTGEGVANLLEKTYIPQALDYIGRSAPVRGLRSKLDWRVRNVYDEDLQPRIAKGSEYRDVRDQASTRDAIYDLEDLKRLGIDTPDMLSQLRMAMEGVDPKFASIEGKYNDNVLKVAARIRAENARRADFGELHGLFNRHVDEAGVQHAPRSINPNHGKSAGGVKDRAVMFRGHKKGTVGIEEIITDPTLKKIRELSDAGGKPARETIRKMSGYIKRIYGKGRRGKEGKITTPGLDLYEETYTSPVTGKVKNRPLRLAKYLYEHPDVMDHGLFTNNPIFDVLQYNLKSNFRESMIPAVMDAAVDHIKRGAGKAAKAAGNHGTAKELIGILGMKKRSGAQFVELMSRKTGIPAEKIKKIPLSRGFIENAARAMSSPIHQAAVPEVSGFFKSLMTAWKARTLAHPSTRARDFLSGKAQGLLMKQLTRKGNANASSLLRGEQLSGYADDPLVEMSLRRAGEAATPETETMALRAALGAGHPVQHGVVGDLPEASYGVSAEDMLQNSPGHTPRTWGRFGSDVANIVSGKTFDPATQEWVPSRWQDIINPFAVKSAFGYERSLNPRYALSEYLAHHGDRANRIPSSLGQADQGLPLAEAMRRTNLSQVDYNPEKFSNFERDLKLYGIPFYGFSSRMAKHTLGELATNPGGRTAQMIKASARASQGDPSVPDEVNASASIPFRWPWLENDGSKNYLAGFGLMHEDPINKFGAILRGDIPGFLKSAGSMVGPIFKPPIELMTGKSLFNGEDLDDLDPSLGRTLSNIGVMAGLLPEDARPVGSGDRGWTGSLVGAADRLIGYSPFGRDMNTIRMLTDVRPSKSALDKILQLSTGYRTTSITPERQQKVLRKRLEDAAKGLGAREISNVSFSPEQMDAIRQRDPQTADNLQKLQRIIRSMQRRNTSKKKKEKTR